MIKFKQKRFTIQEGHYTGPKDMDKVPGAISVITKSAAAGAGIGAIASKFIKDTTITEGAISGTKYGTLSGILLKLFINHLHNPMSTVKYNEIDKNIRREFGIYRVSGITMGDTLDKRESIEDKFSFNDRNITNYKLNFAIQNNKITMYTLDLSDQNLEKLNKILDYYCKKYFGMEYTSSIIDSKNNSYSIDIIFTNYQVISNFIMEISKSLEEKINLLDNRALVSRRLQETKLISNSESEERSYSVNEFNKYEIGKILVKSIPTGGFPRVLNTKTAELSYFLMSVIINSIKKLKVDDLSKMYGNNKLCRDAFSNVFLEDVLKENRYSENVNYTVGNKKSIVNISVSSGIFIITVLKDSKPYKLIEDSFYHNYKNLLTRSDSGKVVVYSYAINSRREFNYLLKKFMSLKLIPNIFE